MTFDFDGVVNETVNNVTEAQIKVTGKVYRNINTKVLQ